MKCSTNSAIQAAKKYYDEKSELKGKYKMTPLKSLNRGSKTCDIRYKHVPVPGYNGYTGVGFRTFEYNSKGDVVKMGGYKSGTLADRGHKLKVLCNRGIDSPIEEHEIKKNGI